MNTYEKAIKKYGVAMQTIVAIEELSELIQALTKSLRGFYNEENIAEEMADVKIMLEQLELMHNNKEAIQDYVKAKLKRLEDNIRE